MLAIKNWKIDGSSKRSTKALKARNFSAEGEA